MHVHKQSKQAPLVAIAGAFRPVAAGCAGEFSEVFVVAN